MAETVEIRFEVPKRLMVTLDAYLWRIQQATQNTSKIDAAGIAA